MSTTPNFLTEDLLFCRRTPPHTRLKEERRKEIEKKGDRNKLEFSIRQDFQVPFAHGQFEGGISPIKKCPSVGVN